MAELNFNALAVPGPKGFYQGFEQGQEAKVTSEMNQLKLESLKRDRDEALQLQTQLKSMGQDPDLNKYMDTLIATGKPEYVQMAIEGKQKLKDLEAYAKLGTGNATPPAPALGAPTLRMPTTPAPAGELGSGTFGMEPAASAPVNAMAPAQVAPVNAMAPQAQQAQARITQLLDFARTNPRMAKQAMEEARLLQNQLELYSKPGQNEPADAVMMRQLGYPLTQAGYQAYRDAQRQERMLTPAEEAQRVRIALASRPPIQPAAPRPEQPPVAVVDPTTGKQVYVTREEALKGRMTPAAAMESLPPKEIQKREATLPQATSAVQGFESKSDKFIADLKALRNDPGLENITGPVFGRTGSVSREGSRAQALYDKVVAKGGFQALQDLRDASKTGGALGNVSNQEGKQLTASFSAIDRRQNAADVRAAIDQAIADIEGSKTRMREAYDTTYSYKSGGGAAPAAPSRAAPVAGANVVVTPDGQSHSFPTPAAAAQFKKAAGL